MSDCGCNGKIPPCVGGKGDRGLMGPVGPQGEPGPAGPAGGGIVNKVNYFAEVTSEVAINGTDFYQPVGYTSLTYVNATTDTQILIAHAVAEAVMNISNADDIQNWVEMALVKTVLGVDSYTYISYMKIDLRIGIFDELAPGNTPITIISPLPPRQVTTDEDNPVMVRFGQGLCHQTGAAMKKVTLQPGESISVMFKNKGGDTRLDSAQLFVQELDM